MSERDRARRILPASVASQVTLEGPERVEVCLLFRDGICTMGDSCMFAHSPLLLPLPAAAAATAAAAAAAAAPGGVAAPLLGGQQRQEDQQMQQQHQHQRLRQQRQRRQERLHYWQRWHEPLRELAEREDFFESFDTLDTPRSFYNPEWPAVSYAAHPAAPGGASAQEFGDSRGHVLLPRYAAQMQSSFEEDVPHNPRAVSLLRAEAALRSTQAAPEASRHPGEPQTPQRPQPAPQPASRGARQPRYRGSPLFDDEFLLGSLLCAAARDRVPRLSPR